MRILVVEDEDAIAKPLVEGLRREGFDVSRVATGAAALAAPLPDLVLLDLRLPDIDGTEVCRLLRARSDVPIIVVTAKGEEVDRVVGLELGADDYVSSRSASASSSHGSGPYCGAHIAARTTPACAPARSRSTFAHAARRWTEASSR